MDLIARTKEAVKEFDNIRYRRMKKVFLDQDERSSLNASQLSVPTSSLIEANELIIMDMDSSNTLSCPNLDDDDSRSTDFISDSQAIYPDEDGSLNSSQSSLQQPSSFPGNSLLAGRKSLIASQATSNTFQRFETTNPSCLQPLKIAIDEPDVPTRHDVSVRSRAQSLTFDSSLFQSITSNTSSTHFNQHLHAAAALNEFSTIKTSRIVIREQREHDQEDQQREQFRGYKQMRRQHQKQLKQVS